MKELALCLSPGDWRPRKLARRVRAWHHALAFLLRLRVRVWPIATTWRSEPHPEQWLLIEMAEDREGADQVLAVQPAGIHPSASTGGSGQTARWIIERDYQELKQELGLGHFPKDAAGAAFITMPTLAIAAYGFLVRGAVPFSPSARFAANAGQRTSVFAYPMCKSSYAPRGSQKAGANRTA